VVPAFDHDVQVEVVTDLPSAITKADIITCATSASEPLIPGALVRPGTHVDLVGGFREDMREADDDLFLNARVYVDDFSTAQVSGDICGPKRTGALRRIEGDLYDLCRPEPFFRAAEEITVYKNAGGAHLDLVIAQTVRSLHL